MRSGARKHFGGAASGLLFGLLLVAAPAMAQEGEASAADATTGWIYRWLNFAIVFGGIVYAFVKWGGPVFRARTEEISQQIEEGARAREAAERSRSEIQGKLAGIEEEVRQMREQSKRDAEAEAQRLRGLAREEAERIESAGQAEITAAERAARIELKALGARKAVETAEGVLRREMTPNAEAAIFEAFVADLQERVN